MPEKNWRPLAIRTAGGRGNRPVAGRMYGRPPAVGGGWFAAGAVFGALGVAAGAYGSHALSPPAAVLFEIGVRYHLIHALALLGVGYAAQQWPGRSPGLAGWLFLIGIGLFSGSLYLRALTDGAGIPGAPPIGGLSLMAGWAVLASAPFRAGRRDGIATRVRPNRRRP